ncbi:2-isopropylmalate synthase [Marinobacter arenosus]|uniref:2-isopropylmalate synthase n=1 Tax=Marinobacter arenosus TaxID=2856822 RepID=UPI001C4A8365|nr:2-isopropylmalate synthase [Marinobacter arenosus]MBW0148700.1 2-isopropylmalate synthase [Marinobacter arenosus]
MMQSETQRQFYLGMAGVRLWYARDALPGAAPSPEYVFDEEQGSDTWVPEQPLPSPSGSQSPGAASSGDARKEAGAVRVANLQALMEDAQSNSSQPEPADVPAEPPEAEEHQGPGAEESMPEAKSAEPMPELNLQLWVGRDVSLVASLSTEASLRLQETLAENILKSLGETELRKVGPVRWPVFNNLRAPGNSMADLRAVLMHALSELQGQKVVALGLAGPDGFESEQSWLHHLSGTRPDLDFSGTLAELASNPSQKRALWQQLKSLAGR